MSIPPGRRRSVLHPRPLQPRATTARRAPDREDDDQLPKLIDREVDMVPGLGHEHAPDRLAALGRIHRADGRGAGDQLPRLGELTSEEVASPGPVLTPPCVHLGRLALGLRREDELHSRASSLPMTASPSTSCPARACAMLRSRAASRRVRSSGSKSSSSITVSSTSAPSGRSVGSSSTSRPPLTCAFSALIAPNILLVLGRVRCLRPSALPGALPAPSGSGLAACLLPASVAPGCVAAWTAFELRDRRMRVDLRREQCGVPERLLHR